MQFAIPYPLIGLMRPVASVPGMAGLWNRGRQVLSQLGVNGTALRTAKRETVVRSGFHGWLAGRRPGFFQAERKKQNGTVLLSPITPRVRAAFHGWLTARAAGNFSRNSDALKGTAKQSGQETVVRPVFHGWLAERRPLAFMSEAQADEFHHISVLPKETAEWMAAAPGKFIIDGTLGGGGHSEMFLEAGAEVLGIDRDPDALSHARKRLAKYGDQFRTWEGNFADYADYSEVQGERQAHGLLLDLGISSYQLDAAHRGFSFRGEGPLDMRMDKSGALTAADIVNEWPEGELLRILREYGEEPRARRIVAAITERRSKKPFETTTDLAECIESAIGRTGKIHPATRSFQAIRIVVNDELGSLERTLERSIDLLKPGGRLLVITFHSLEDRMVKQFMQDRSKPWLDKPEWPEPRPNPRWSLKLPQRKAIAPSQEEIRINPRARSAKLRVAELLAPDTLRP